VQRNGPLLLESLLAAFHGGYCAVPVNARSTPHEVRQIFDDADVGAVLYSPDYAEHVTSGGRAGALLCTAPHETADATIDEAIAGSPPSVPAADVAPDDVAWLFYTSGTTGAPKGAMLTHRNLLMMSMAFLADLRPLDARHSVLHAAPLTHGSGLYAIPALMAGAEQVITTSRSYDPQEILRTIAHRGVTDIAFLSPTMVKWLTEEQQRAEADTSTLEHVVYGGAPMYRDDLEAAIDTFGSVFGQIYGQAEAPMTISRLTTREHTHARTQRAQLLASAGWAYLGAEVAVADESGNVSLAGEGEILTRGPAVMRGYWRNEEATGQAISDGWLRTGDIGRIEPDGGIFLLDRSKDVIISGGANVYPREVEDVILTHRGVRQVAVVGAPDDTWGELVVAVLVPHPDYDHDLLAAEVGALCRERLAGYKCPRHFDWREELPTSPYGKILKREIRDRLWANEGRRI
jgi:acyl-CoA synthetase (AMP-forming)/AMP-acid ligase II